MNNLRYGICPAQVEGITNSGRPFYFRSRGGHSTIKLGEQGWHPSIHTWPNYLDMPFTAEWDFETCDPDRIDNMITAVVGKWREATYEELQFNQDCVDCGVTYISDGSNICMDCVVASFTR